MPLPEGTRVRWKTFPSGKKVRLAFKKGSDEVIEAKSSSGATHTPADFAADRARVEPKRSSYRRKR